MDLQDFHAAPQHDDGFHVVERAFGGPLEVLTLGRPFERASGPVMVVFSGAVQKREQRNPPFASGRNLAPGLNVPLIAISDPSLSLDESLSIAWYAGSASQDVQAAVEALLRPLGERLDGGLWLVGGSAGGFAVLDAAHRLGRWCSAFVWNPQTDIAEYSERHAKHYAAVAYPRLAGHMLGAGWKAAFRDEARSRGRRVDVLGDAIPAQSPRRLLYLQGADDWHMQSHCAPYLEEHSYRRHAPGIWTRGDDKVVWIAETGVGHTPPTADAIQGVLRRLFSGDEASVLQRTLELDERPLFAARAVLERPELLEDEKARIAGLVTWRRRGQVILAESDGLPVNYGRMRWSAVVLNAQNRPLSRSEKLVLPGRWTMPENQQSRRVRLTLEDGFGKILVRRYLQLAQ
ncbi:hypothetical protein AB0271_11305 [Kocuria palustris]|uniref:hypothetical protein n=1 Tax=Kocuria palustris TaxID=71999 RepID=UPI00344C132D